MAESPDINADWLNVVRSIAKVTREMKADIQEYDTAWWCKKHDFCR